MAQNTGETIDEIKKSLVAALKERAEQEGPDDLEGEAGVCLMIEDASGNVIRTDTVRYELDILTVHGFYVEDPDGQAVDGDSTELSEEELLSLPVETLQQVVEHFGANNEGQSAESGFVQERDRKFGLVLSILTSVSPLPIGWQIVETGTDNPPPGMTTYEVYPYAFVMGWIYAAKQKGEGAKWRLLPIFEGDIEEPVIIRDEDITRKQS